MQQQFDRPAHAITRGSIVASVRGKKLTVNQGRGSWKALGIEANAYVELALRVAAVRGHAWRKKYGL